MLNIEAANESATFYAHKAMRLELLLAQQQQAFDKVYAENKRLESELRAAQPVNPVGGPGDPLDGIAPQSASVMP